MLSMLQLMVTSRSVEDRNDELNELMRKFNMERETSSRLKEENMKLKACAINTKFMSEYLCTCDKYLGEFFNRWIIFL